MVILGIPVGVMLVEFGPLNGMQLWMKKQVVSLADGTAVSLFGLTGLTGLTFWALALFFAILTAALVGVFRKRRQVQRTDFQQERNGAFERIMTKPWRPWVAGVAIGLLMAPAYLSSAASGRN